MIIPQQDQPLGCLLLAIKGLGFGQGLQGCTPQVVPLEDFSNHGLNIALI